MRLGRRKEYCIVYGTSCQSTSTQCFYFNLHFSDLDFYSRIKFINYIRKEVGSVFFSFTVHTIFSFHYTLSFTFIPLFCFFSYLVCNFPLCTDTLSTVLHFPFYTLSYTLSFCIFSLHTIFLHTLSFYLFAFFSLHTIFLHFFYLFAFFLSHYLFAFFLYTLSFCIFSLHTIFLHFFFTHYLFAFFHLFAFFLYTLSFWIFSIFLHFFFTRYLFIFLHFFFTHYLFAFFLYTLPFPLYALYFICVYMYTASICLFRVSSCPTVSMVTRQLSVTCPTGRPIAVYGL